MSLETVKSFFQPHNMAHQILEFPVSSATVDLAAAAIGTIPAKIAKTLSFQQKEDGGFLIVTAGDAKIDNPKFRHYFQMKAKMLTPEEVLALTGHAVGGVCPFGINPHIPIYLDISLQRFQTVFPACGSGNSAIEIACDTMFTLANAEAWIDVCKDWDPTLSEQ
ncbi:MAG: YbaK/EbsC family protein [Oscillospiraceae bacterium]|nr:YbaK/EbsC family protein [Oscillospiraceae bacterium]